MHSFSTWYALNCFDVDPNPIIEILQKSTNQLLFARDPLGRRSLLIHKPTPSNPYFMLASVACGASDGYSFQDISTEHIYCLSLSGLEKEVNVRA